MIEEYVYSYIIATPVSFKAAYHRTTIEVEKLDAGVNYVCLFLNINYYNMVPVQP